VDSAIANAAEIVADTRERFLPELPDRYPGVTVGSKARLGRAPPPASMAARFRPRTARDLHPAPRFQFRSFIEPLVVMTRSPGPHRVIGGHLMHGQSLSMPSMMGFVSLAGIVVNDSILLVEFLKLRVREGMTLAEAAGGPAASAFEPCC
jgi:hydrophobic/amphiphilic exporter-1 (mainly G- bacteria), HAE1 family